jgi:hypothetical protein
MPWSATFRRLGRVAFIVKVCMGSTALVRTQVALFKGHIVEVEGIWRAYGGRMEGICRACTVWCLSTVRSKQPCVANVTTNSKSTPENYPY